MSIELQAFRSFDGKLYDLKTEAQSEDINKLVKEFIKRINNNSDYKLIGKIRLINAPDDLNTADRFYSFEEINFDFKFEHFKDEVNKLVENLLNEAEKEYNEFQNDKVLD